MEHPDQYAMLRNDPSIDTDRPWAMEAGILFGREAAKRGVIVLNDPKDPKSGYTTVPARREITILDRAAAGFQFAEFFPLVPSFGISYNLALDGMGLVLVLLTAVILFAGVFASWTVRSRRVIR